MDASQMSLEELTASIRQSADSQQRVLNVLAEKLKAELDGVAKVKVSRPWFVNRSKVYSIGFTLFPFRYVLFLGRRGLRGSVLCQRCLKGRSECEHDRFDLSVKEWLDAVSEDLRAQAVDHLEVETIEAGLGSRLLSA